MAKIGVSICPFMTRDPENPVFCKQDCACFCTYKNITVEEHDGWCGLMPD